MTPKYDSLLDDIRELDDLSGYIPYTGSPSSLTATLNIIQATINNDFVIQAGGNSDVRLVPSYNNGVYFMDSSNVNFKFGYVEFFDTVFSYVPINLGDNIKMYFGDDNDSSIHYDGSGNLIFTDAVTGSRTLKQLGCPTYKKLIATGQSAGSLNLTYASWGISKAWLKRLVVTLESGTSTDFDIEIYEKDTFLSANKIYSLEANDGNLDVILDYIYEDQDATDELHIKITDSDGTGSPVFGIELRGIELL